jgi:hypothetical protein
MKWRENNLDKYREGQRVYQLEYYKKHGYNKEHKQQYYQWKKICRTYLDLLCNLTP